MKIILSLLLTLMLTACATAPRFLAAIYDNQDHCQKNPYHSYCGASQGTTYVTRDYRTGNYLTTTKAQR